MRLTFAKAQSLGNDFLLIDEKEPGDVSDPAGLARRLCDRHLGVGADGILLVSVTDRAKGRARFRIFNADGSEAETSGNGLRCAAAVLFLQNKADPPDLVFDTLAGRRECRLLGREGSRFHIRVEMGAPRFASKDIPFDDGSVHDRVVDYPLPVGRKSYPVTVLSMGNPHCLLFFDRFPARDEWHRIGREIETHSYFPKRTNVEFVRVLNRSEIEVLFWERGVGETLSSGSGSSACAVGAALKGLTEKTVEVVGSRGRLTVEWTGDNVYQFGPAEVVFDGAPL